MLSRDFMPRKPFEDYKWKWAVYQPTESLNDPVVLLGVLFRMRKLEDLGFKYSSPNFNAELAELENDLSDSIGVNLRTRGGSRNLIRNSGQYWRALGLIPSNDNSGNIQLTEFGRKIADRLISQSEFAALTIRTFTLPNPFNSTSKERELWEEHGLIIKPLLLILRILRELHSSHGIGYLSAEELIRVVIPLAGVKARLEDYVNFVIWYREDNTIVQNWPNCCTGANDKRMAREFLLFLEHYGYTVSVSYTHQNRFQTNYLYNDDIDNEVAELVSDSFVNDNEEAILSQFRQLGITSEIDFKRITKAVSRPNQPVFRKMVLQQHKRCIVTNAQLPTILEAAHIKPFRYKGPDTVENGFAMRCDVHKLFDSGHLRISPNGDVFLTNAARMDYGSQIPPSIAVPSITNREHLRWRWENYDAM